MKILKLLSKKNFSIVLIILSCLTKSYAEEKPVDIWNIDKEEINESAGIEEPTLNNIKDKSLPEFDIYNMQSQKINQIQLDEQNQKSTHWQQN